MTAAAMRAYHPLSAEGRAGLDRILEDSPGATTLLIAVGTGVNAVSVPAAISVKRGMIYDLHEMVFPSE